MPAAFGQSRAAIVIAAGVLLGLAYTLSPLSILALSALMWAMVAASRGLSEAEQRWFWSIMSISVAIRLLAIAWLFYTADPAHPFASFFGDEELYKFRTMWLRNIGEGLPMSPADVIYSFDAVGHTSYIYVLAYVQALCRRRAAWTSCREHDAVHVRHSRAVSNRAHRMAASWRWPTDPAVVPAQPEPVSIPVLKEPMSSLS